MELGILFIIGCFATWYLAWSITSCTREENNPDECKPNVIGPFYLFDFVRWFFRQPFMPKLVRENADCPYCVSFWTAFFIALWLPIYDHLTWVGSIKLFYVFWIGMSGVIAFWFRRIRILYGLEAKEN